MLRRDYRGAFGRPVPAQLDLTGGGQEQEADARWAGRAVWCGACCALGCWVLADLQRLMDESACEAHIDLLFQMLASAAGWRLLHQRACCSSHNDLAAAALKLSWLGSVPSLTSPHARTTHANTCICASRVHISSHTFFKLQAHLLCRTQEDGLLLVAQPPVGRYLLTGRAGHCVASAASGAAAGAAVGAVWHLLHRWRRPAGGLAGRAGKGAAEGWGSGVLLGDPRTCVYVCV